ncbi:hypothetical protein HDV00_004308 [Rhizophlyctis rosea]|nr:hypothetical protein HDV00_004308 [Rhizophlyctis rosea]
MSLKANMDLLPSPSASPIKQEGLINEIETKSGDYLDFGLGSPITPISVPAGPTQTQRYMLQNFFATSFASAFTNPLPTPPVTPSVFTPSTCFWDPASHPNTQDVGTLDELEVSLGLYDSAPVPAFKSHSQSAEAMLPVFGEEEGLVGPATPVQALSAAFAGARVHVTGAEEESEVAAMEIDEFLFSAPSSSSVSSSSPTLTAASASSPAFSTFSFASPVSQAEEASAQACGCPSPLSLPVSVGATRCASPVAADAELGAGLELLTDLSAELKLKQEVPALTEREEENQTATASNSDTESEVDNSESSQAPLSSAQSDAGSDASASSDSSSSDKPSKKSGKRKRSNSSGPPASHMFVWDASPNGSGSSSYPPSYALPRSHSFPSLHSHAFPHAHIHMPMSAFPMTPGAYPHTHHPRSSSGNAWTFHRCVGGSGTGVKVIGDETGAIHHHMHSHPLTHIHLHNNIISNATTIAPRFAPLTPHHHVQPHTHSFVNPSSISQPVPHVHPSLAMGINPNVIAPAPAILPLVTPPLGVGLGVGVSASTVSTATTVEEDEEGVVVHRRKKK